MEPQIDKFKFYFVHSYHLQCRHAEDVTATAVHGYPFAAGIARDHISGFQFHPEKSHKFGMQVLDNFAAWNPQNAGGSTP